MYNLLVSLFQKRWFLAFIALMWLLTIIGISMYTGFLSAAYEFIYTHTTGRPWTFIMRDFPVYLIIPALVVLACAARWLPLKYWARITFMTIVFFIGLMCGHVFW